MMQVFFENRPGNNFLRDLNEIIFTNLKFLPSHRPVEKFK